MEYFPTYSTRILIEYQSYSLHSDNSPNPTYNSSQMAKKIEILESFHQFANIETNFLLNSKEKNSQNSKQQVPQKMVEST